MFNDFPKGYYSLFMQIQARNLGLLAPYQLLFLFCQSTSSMSHPPLQGRILLYPPNPIQMVYILTHIIAKLTKKFKSNCFFYYSRNSGSITVKVLQRCTKCHPIHNFFLPYWAISKQAFPRLCDTGQSLQPVAKEHFTNQKLLTQLKSTAYLGF